MGRPQQTEDERQKAIADCLARFAAGRAGRTIDEVREVWAERAAIREYVGGMRHRRNAELHAIGDTFDYFVAREARKAAG